jgi:hypothetical protein
LLNRDRPEIGSNFLKAKTAENIKGYIINNNV